MIRLCWFLIPCLAVVLGFVPPARAQEKGAKSFATPQEAFDAAVAAVHKKNMKGALEVLTDESRDAMTGTVIFVGSMIIAFSEIDPKEKEKVKELKDIFAKHGVTEDALKKLKDSGPGPNFDPKTDSEAMKKAMGELGHVVKKDRAGFVAEVFGFLAKQPGSHEALLFDNAKLEDLKIDGNHAKGTIASKENGQTKREPIEFKKVGKGWKIDLPAEHFKVQFGPPGKK
jgi:hypothetical protein